MGTTEKKVEDYDMTPTVNPNWRMSLDQRQRSLIADCEQYSMNPYGREGHNAHLLIAALAAKLDKAAQGSR